MKAKEAIQRNDLVRLLKYVTDTNFNINIFDSGVMTEESHLNKAASHRLLPKSHVRKDPRTMKASSSGAVSSIHPFDASLILHAMKLGKFIALEILFRAGANCNVVCPHTGKTLFQYALEARLYKGCLWLLNREAIEPISKQEVMDIHGFIGKRSDESGLTLARRLADY